MKKIFSKIVFIMVLMLFTISTGCSNNKNSFEKWAKDIQSEFTDEKYSTCLDHSDGLGIDFYSLYGEKITELYDYNLEDIKKLKYADGINHFQISEEFSDILEVNGNKYQIIANDFKKNFIAKLIGKTEYHNSFFSDDGFLGVLNDGRKCFVQFSVSTLLKSVVLVIYIYE